MAGLLEYLLKAHLAGPQTGLLANMPGAIPPVEDDGGLMARPAGSVAPPDGGLLRPGSLLDSLFSGGGAQAAPAAPSANAGDYAGLADAFGSASQPSLPPSTNDPQSGEPQVFANGVPLQRPKPQSIVQQPDPGQTPPAAAPMSMAPGMTAMAAAPAAPAAAAPGGGIGDFLGKVLSPQNAPMLLALGSGFAGAPSFGTGMRRAFGAAAPVAAADRAYSEKQTGVAAKYRSLVSQLVAKGVPQNEAAQLALGAVYSPEQEKALIAKHFETKPRQHVSLKGALGDETPASFDPNTGKYFDAAGKEMGGGGGDGVGGGSSILAPGVKYDANLTGDDYLNQFSNDVKAAAKAYINGDVIPSGNPRQKSIANYAKTVAQRYGQDMGIPVSDSTYGEKRKYRQELGSASANSAGGQIKAFSQGIEHAEALGKQLEKLKNVDPIGIPSVAYGANWLRQKFSTKQTAIAKEAASIGQTLAGEVGKLFSGSQGGGVHERELTRQRFDTITSPGELAGALDATLETMEGGLRALEQRRDQIMGPNNNIVLTPKETRDKIASVRETIRRLRGGEAPPGAAPAGKTGTGIQWSIVP